MSLKENLYVWSYADCELELDLGEAETAKRYYELFTILQEDEKAIKRDVPTYTFIEQYCTMFERLFDGLFGEGTYIKLTHGKTRNINVANIVYEDFLDFVKRQSDDTQMRSNKLAHKYSPNRSERRANKNHG